jgi:mannose-6-phosphate isomerase-like protein (cupin superfamily)
MDTPTRWLPICSVVFSISVALVIFASAASSEKSSGVPPPTVQEKLPDKEFTHPPEKPHDPAALYFKLDQLEHFYRVPGEFGHRLIGDQYGFEALSFIVTETHPGGGPALHLHDVEEAHVLLEGSAQYRIGDETFTVQAPYVAKVPAGVPHAFMNVGTKPFNLVAVFASKRHNTTRLGPNPLVHTGTQQPSPIAALEVEQAAGFSVRHSQQ